MKQHSRCCNQFVFIYTCIWDWAIISIVFSYSNFLFLVCLILLFLLFCSLLFITLMLYPSRKKVLMEVNILIAWYVFDWFWLYSSEIHVSLINHLHLILILNHNSFCCYEYFPLYLIICFFKFLIPYKLIPVNKGMTL